MAKTIRTYTSNGIQTLYPIDFTLGYIDKEHIYVYLGVDPLSQLNYSWVTDSQIELEVPVAAGISFNIRRIVPRDRLVNDYEDGAILHEQNLDDSHLQHLMLLEELEDEAVIGDPPTEVIQEITETQILGSGQTEVTFVNAVSGATFHIAGDAVDSGHLREQDMDESKTTVYSITLVTSYPVGTELTLTKTQRSLVDDVTEEAPNDGRPFVRKSLTWVEGLEASHAGGTRTHAEIDTDLDSTVVKADNNALAILGLSSTVSDNTTAIGENAVAIGLLQVDRPSNQTGTAYTLGITDSNKTVWMKNATANVLTIPLNATTAFPINTVILIMMEGLGVTSITATTGVTLNGINGGSGDLVQYAGVTLVKRGNDNWLATPLVVA